jgi:hypothetical protein
MKDKIGTLSVHGQPLPILQRKTYRFRIILVMVGNIILTDSRPFRVEIVTSGFKKQGDLIAGSDLSLDVL